MNKKTAIIIGVIILVLTSVITPFILKKIRNKAKDISQETQLEEVNKQEENSYQLGDETLSGEVNSNEKEQIGSGDESEEQKTTEISGEQKNEEQESGESTNEYKATSSQGATNKTTQSEKEKNNVSTNIAKETINEKTQNIEVIEVVKNDMVSQETQIPTVQEAIGETVQSNVIVPEGAVGVLKIDKLGINQKVADGHSLEVLKKDLGHVDSTAYSTGNVGILGHNSGNAGYFKNLWDLKLDDVIEYTTSTGTKTYKVSEVVQIADDDWSKLANTTDNRITLITCVKNVPEKRWCIQGIEI